MVKEVTREDKQGIGRERREKKGLEERREGY